MSRDQAHAVNIARRCLRGVDAMAFSTDRSFPRHSHDQFGVGVMHWGGHRSWSNIGPVEAGPGDVIAVSPNEMHDGEPVNAPRSWCMVFLDPSVVTAFVGREAAAREFGFAARRDPEVAVITLRALRYLREGNAAAAEEALTTLCDTMLSSRSNLLPGDVTPSPATERALQRIRDCPEAPPSLNDIATLMGMSRTSALRRFKKEVGATPHDHSMQYRLGLARRALAQGAVPAEAALRLGFADQSHMTRAFQRQFGLPPGRYQKACAIT